jgi:exonuclease SbcD
MIKVAHFSDLHYSGRNLVEADRCFAFAVDEAIRRGVDLAVVSGDATDHSLDVHSPAVERLASQIRRLADHCPVLMLQGTYSHEPPGTLAIFPLLGGAHPVFVVDRISQVALDHRGRWLQSEGWGFTGLPAGAQVVLTCVPTVNKASVAVAVGATRAAEAVGCELAALLAGYGAINGSARRASVPTLGVSHGTVSGCVTEHGVPMAGLDHEFTTTSLFDANAQAFLLGHIHKHQHWADDGRLIAYAGSIGRFHFGEPDAKGFLIWEVSADRSRFDFVPTPARRTVDLTFEGPPDADVVAAAMREQDLAGAFVRLRWTVGEESRAQVDRAALERALEGAAGVQMEGRVVPVVRSRAQGISRAASLNDKVLAWADVTGVQAAPLLERLTALTHRDPHQIAGELLTGTGVDAADEERPTPAAIPAPASPPASMNVAEPELF